MKRKRKPEVKSQVIVVRAYPVLERAVEDGVSYGLLRRCVEKCGYLRLADNANYEQPAIDEIVQAVMNSICEAVQFGGEE